MLEKRHTTVFDYFYRCADIDVKYIRHKLCGSIVRVLREAGFAPMAGVVDSVNGDPEILVRVPVGRKEARSRNVSIPADKLVLAPLDLGYTRLVKYGEDEEDHWAFLMRIPRRQWKAGLTLQNMSSSTGFGNTNVVRTLSDRWGGKPNYYPTFEEACAQHDDLCGPGHTRFPWSKDFAIVRPGSVVMFREYPVGMIENGCVRFKSNSTYLKEEAERTGAIVHA